MNPETGEVIHCAKYWGKSPLHLAVLDDNPKQCEELITEGEDVNIVYCGMTPLHLACKVGHRGMVETLIRLKSDVNAGTMMEGCTPLHMSSNFGHQELTDVLLQNGADINRVDEKGMTPLWLASQNGHTAAAHRLIEQGMDVNKANNDGVSPLAVAVFNGSTEVAEALVAANCQIDQADNSGCTPLYHAVKAGQREISRLLAEAGATVNQSTNSGDYPIHLAALYGNINILDTLIKWGADVTVSSSRGTPLYCAVQRQHVNAARRLIQAGAMVDVVFTKSATATCSTPLIDAVCHRNPNLDLVCTLIQGGCNVDAEVDEKVPIEFALRHGHLDVCRLLLQADCDPFLSHVRPMAVEGKMQSAIQEYLNQMYNPRTLTASCRRTIRASLGCGHHYTERINQLNLPQALKQFLSYARLSPDSQSCLKSKR